jgi:hypothetical protein
MSGPPPRCVRLCPRLRPPRGPYLDAGGHLPVNAPAFICDPHVEQLLGDCAGRASAVVLRSRRTRQRAIADPGNQFWAACSKRC